MNYTITGQSYNPDGGAVIESVPASLLADELLITWDRPDFRGIGVRLSINEEGNVVVELQEDGYDLACETLSIPDRDLTPGELAFMTDPAEYGSEAGT